ncbi:MAG: TetR/AcrR family transcriptional regulator [Desulfobulbaceae bacterium]|nr:TetR/AcrR family transcriptional regulator [Desulfobulbaceae bacterium]
MAEAKKNTKEHLIDSAGELFAQDGFEGVSTRMIAEKAGVKVSAIHYHFGSKEKLYTESLTRAVEYDSCADFAMVIAENPALLETPVGRAEIIRTTVFRTFYDNFREDTPDWMRQIIVQGIMKPSSVFSDFLETVLKPDVDAARRLYLAARPGADEVQIAAWLDILHSQILLYSVAKEALEVLRGEGSMDTEFYRGVARVVARAMILELELPLPVDLEQ